MTLTISWNTLSINEWEEHFNVLPCSNLLQSYEYAIAQCRVEKQSARWGAIQINGKLAGLVQMLEASLFWKAVHGVIIDRGPLWLPGFGGALHTKLFFDEINRQFPLRFGRKRRIIPEIEDGPTARKLIDQTGLIRVEQTKGYETSWVDLSPEEDNLRAGLKQNWRNRLNKADREKLVIDLVGDQSMIGNFIGLYAADKAARHYSGPSPAFLRAYLPLIAAKGDLLALSVSVGGHPVAFTITARHGRSATYLLGWAAEKGRELCATQALLWQTMLELKQRDVQEFDLGGVNDEIEGIRHFKEGLGGRPVRLLGHYR